jgi:hypothetical protein
MGFRTLNFPKKRLTDSTPLDQITAHFYSMNEVAALLNRSYFTIRNWCAQGKIKSVKEMDGKNLIPREEVLRLLHVTDDKQFFSYQGIKLPFMPYLMHLMIDTIFNEKEIDERLSNFRLVKPDPQIFFSMKESIIRTAPKNINATLRRGRFVTDRPGYSTWIERLGIAPLFEEVAYPCLGILHDHSTRRVQLEALLCGSIPISDIIEFMKVRHQVIYTEEELVFFQRYFYNLREFSYSDFCAYLSYIKDPNEVIAKRNSWNNPDAAKIHMGIPTRCDFERYIHSLATISAMKAMDLGISGSANQKVDEFKACVDVFSKMFDRMAKQENLKSEAQTEALRVAENKNAQTEIIPVREERTTFEDLDQEEEPESVPDTNKTSAAG